MRYAGPRGPFLSCDWTDDTCLRPASALFRLRLARSDPIWAHGWQGSRAREGVKDTAGRPGYGPTELVWSSPRRPPQSYHTTKTWSNVVQAAALYLLPTSVECEYWKRGGLSTLTENPPCKRRSLTTLAVVTGKAKPAWGHNHGPKGERLCECACHGHHPATATKCQPDQPSGMGPHQNLCVACLVVWHPQAQAQPHRTA